MKVKSNNKGFCPFCKENIKEELNMEKIKIIKEKLTDYVFKFWDNWGVFNFESATDEEIKNVIKKNLSSLDGIEKELDYIRFEFANDSWDEESKEYEELEKLWNYLNWYKTNFKEMMSNVFSTR